MITKKSSMGKNEIRSMLIIGDSILRRDFYVAYGTYYGGMKAIRYLKKRRYIYEAKRVLFQTNLGKKTLQQHESKL